MAQTLKKYNTRAPRYNLRPDDSKIIRFASKKTNKKSYTTHFINISESGLAFRVPPELKPSLGDTIMIEFSVPDAKQMACYARVVRIEELDTIDNFDFSDEHTSDLIIGVRFYHLLSSHQTNLNTGLKERFEHLSKLSKKEEFKKTFSFSFFDFFYNTQVWFKENKTNILLVLGSALILFTAFYLITKPGGNYSPLMLIPWGTREF